MRFMFCLISLGLFGQEALPPEILAKLLKPATQITGYTIAYQDPTMINAFKSAGITLEDSSSIVWVKDEKELKKVARKVLILCGDKDLCSKGAGMALYSLNGKIKATINHKAIQESFTVLLDIYYQAAK